MKYIDQVLQPGEKIVFSSTLSWTVYFPSVLLWLVALLLAAAGSVLQPTGAWLWSALAAAVLAAGSSLKAWFRRWTTEIDVTDRRVVYKRGFIRRHTVEINMDKVE